MLNWISREFLIAVIISLAVAVVALSLSSPPSQRPLGEQGGKHSQTAKSLSVTGNDRVALQIECDPNCSARDSDDYGNRSRLTRLINKTIDDPVALFTFFLGVATFLLVTVVLGQLKDATESSKRQLRAYISIIPKKVLNWMNAPQKIGVSLIVKNHGRTPGDEIVFNFSMEVLDSLPDSAKTDIQYNQNNTIFPDEELPVRLFAIRDLTKQEIAAVEDGSKRFHVWGIMNYRDAFDEKRTTTFSLSFGGIDFAKAMKNVSDAEWFWEHGQHHNDAT